MQAGTGCKPTVTHLVDTLPEACQPRPNLCATPRASIGLHGAAAQSTVQSGMAEAERVDVSG